MPIDADALLAGPRGRRLCLELVQQAEPITEARQHFGDLVFVASYRMAKASGASITFYTSGTGGGSDPDDQLPDPTPPRSPPLSTRSSCRTSTTTH